MQQRGRSGRPVKGRRANRPKARKKPISAPSIPDLQKQLEALSGELKEALQQQTVTADVLKVISRSAFDLDAVLNTLVQSAVVLSGGSFGTIFQKRGELFYLTAAHGYTPEMLAYGQANPLAPGTESNVGRTAMTGSVGDGGAR